MKIDWVKGIEKAKQFLGRTAELLKAFVTDVKKSCVTMAGKAGPLTARLLQGFSSIRSTGGKKGPMLFVFGGAVVFFLIVLILVLSLNARGRRESAPIMRAAYTIPPEELFIPDEPDFLPDFLLEREPRHFWSVEDIRPYWRIPGNPEFWQDVIRSTVDELMENVP